MKQCTKLGGQFDFAAVFGCMGGAPLLIRDRAVGLLRMAFTDASQVFSTGGMVHSMPIQHVVEFCNGIVPG